jgi:G3E family GTPase
MENSRRIEGANAEQIAFADAILINKVDLVSADELAQIESGAPS